MTSQVERFPLAKLYVAPENARFGASELGDLGALAASILEVGDLIDPLHVYGPDDDGNYAVWDGGRRWNALMTLVKGKKSKLPPALAAGVPCIVSSKETALLHSLATFNREQMHPADEFLAYKRMFDSGMEPARIAAACAVATPRVNQLLRLNGVAPEILDAFKAGELALDVVEAFTLSLDHDKQRAVLDATRQKGRAPTSWAVKAAFKETAMSARDPWAVFVGREAYEAAGGDFLCDLFDDEEDFANGALVKLLAQQKLDALLAEVQAEGWAKVEFVDRHKYNWSNGFERQKEPWSDEFKATACAFVRQDYTGEMKVERGFYRPSRSATATGAAALKPDQSLYGWGHKGHGVMTQAATQATAAALVSDPAAAYDGLLTHLALATLFDYSDQNTASLMLPQHRWGAPTVETSGDGEVDAMQEAWRLRLKAFAAERSYSRQVECRDVTGLCDFIAALDADEKAQLMALCFAKTLWAYEAKSNERHPGRWAHLSWMAQRAQLDMAAAWTPDADFLKGGSKEALLDALKDQGHSGTWNTAPKKEMVSTVAGTAKRDRWLPKLLANLGTKAEPKTKAKAKGKGGQKAAQPEAPANPDEATMETLTPDQLLILAELNHKLRTAPHTFRMSEDSPTEVVVPISKLSGDEWEALRPLAWGGFLHKGSLAGVTDFVKLHDKALEAGKRKDAPKVSAPYKTRWLNPAAEAADEALDPALEALATGKARPIPEADDED